MVKDGSLAMSKILIIGTSYIHGAAASEMFRLWADTTLRLNPDADILVVDSASPMELPYYPPPLKYLNLPDNVGHLARGGKDGWGRAFSAGIGYAIRNEYEWVANIECDMLCAVPVEEIFAKMIRAGVKCCAPMAMPYHFTETGCSFWSVPYLAKSKLVETYDWQNSKPTGPLPEQRIDAICAEDMFALPMRGMRNDARYNADQIQAMFPFGIDWITHCELPVARRFMEMNKLGEVEYV